MSSIKDQLLQMGLVAPAQTGDGGDAGSRGERRGRRGRGRGRGRGERPAADASATAPPAETAPSDADAALIARLVDAGRIDDALGGRRRFYYESRDDRVRYLDVQDTIAARLERRDAAICEAPDGALTVVDAETARRIAALDRRWLRS